MERILIQKTGRTALLYQDVVNLVRGKTVLHDTRWKITMPLHANQVKRRVT